MIEIILSSITLTWVWLSLQRCKKNTFPIDSVESCAVSIKLDITGANETKQEIKFEMEAFSFILRKRD